MNLYIFRRLTVSLFVLIVSSIAARADQTDWTGAAGDDLWTTVGNWEDPATMTNVLPSTTVDAVIDNPVAGGIIGIENQPVSAASLSVSQTNALEIITDATDDNLSVVGNISNNGAGTLTLAVPILTTGTLTAVTYNGGTAGINFSQGITTNLTHITAMGAITLSGPSPYVFTLNSTASAGHGAINLGTGATISGENIKISLESTANYTPTAGDFFQIIGYTFGQTDLTGASIIDVDTSINQGANGVGVVQALVPKGIVIFQATAGGNIIKTGVTLPIDNDNEFNTGGITFEGGELVTSNNEIGTGTTSFGTALNAGTPFVTNRTIAINGTGGTIAATTATTGTYTSANGTGGFVNGDVGTGTLTFGDSTNTGIVDITTSSTLNTFTGTYAVANGTLQLDGGTAASSKLTIAAGSSLTGAGTVGGITTVNGGAINGTGLALTGLVTFNGVGNTLSGTESGGGGLTLATAAGVIQTGTFTGNLNTTSTGTFTANGRITGTAGVAANGTLAGSGTIGGTTSVTSGTINGTGLVLTGIATFNAANNVLSGTETGTGGVTLATGAGVTQTGTFTGNLNTTSTGTFTANGRVTGSATVAAGGTLNGTGTIGGTTGVTSGTVNGSALVLTGITTFNGAGNVLSGTESDANGINLAAGAGVTQTGTFTGALNTTSTGTFTANGDVTGNATVAAGGTLAGTGIIGGTTGVTSGTVNGNGLVLTGLTTFNGAGGTLSGTESDANGVTLVTGAGVTQTGTFTGNLNTTSTGTFTANGKVTGNATVVAGGTLAGSGTIGGTTGVTSGTVNGTGLVLTGLTTFNGAGNALSGTESDANGVTLATGAGVTQTGTFTGNLNTTSTGTFTANGKVTGTATVVAGGTLAGSGTIGGTTGVTSGTINGSGLVLTGLTTFNGAGNALSGTESDANGVTLATGAGVTQTGTFTGNLNTTSTGTFTANGDVTGNATVVTGGTLGGTGIIGGTTGVTGGTINGTGLVLTGLATFNGSGNTLSGTETDANGATLAAGAGVTQTGTFTGNLNTTNTGTFTANGKVTGNATVVAGGTLAGTGLIGGTTGVTGGTISGTGLVLTGLTTFNGAGNLLSGTESGAAGLTLAAGAGVIQTGTFTGALNTTNTGTFTANGDVTGAATVASGGTLAGNGTIGGATGVTGGTINGTGLVLTGLTTFNGAGNTLSGTESDANGLTLAAGAGVTQTGTFTGNLNTTNTGTFTANGKITGTASVATGGTLTGDGVIGGTTSVTGGTINGSTLMLTGGLTFNGAGNTLSGSETATGGISLAPGAALANSAAVTGGIAIGSGTLSGSGGSFSGASSLNGGTINLTSGSFGSTLAVTGGTWAGAGSVTGLVSVGAGTFRVSGTLTDSAGVAVNSGGTLGGAGTIAGPVSLNTGGSAAHLAPGATTGAAGTLTIGGLTIGSGSDLDIDFSNTATTVGGGINDLINLNSGVLDFISGGTTVVNFSQANPLTTGTYTLIENADTVSNFNSETFQSTGLANGVTASYSVVTVGMVSALDVHFTSQNFNNYYYIGGSGANQDDFTVGANYTNAVSGGLAQTTGPDINSDVYIAASSPTPSNLTPDIGANQVTIDSLTFLTSNATLQSSTNTGTLTLVNGVTEATGASNDTISAAVLLSNGATNAEAVTVADAASVLTDSGGIGGAIGLTKLGSGTLVLSGHDTYTGATTISTGAVDVENAQALSGTSAVTVASGAALQLQGGITTTAAVPLTLSGVGLNTGGHVGALENLSGNNTYSGLISLAANTTIGSDSGTLTVSNTGTIAGGGFGLTLAGAGSGMIASVIGPTVGSLTMSSAGQWTLSGVNTYTGLTTVNSGNLVLTAVNGIADSSEVDLKMGSALDISAASQTFNNLTGDAFETITLGGSQLTVDSVSSSTFAGNINGTTGSFVKTGAGTLTLANPTSNTFSGGTTIHQGILKVTAVNSSLGTGAITLSGGELLTTDPAPETAANFTLAAGTNTLAATAATKATYTGTFSSTGSLTFGDAINTGTIVLTADNIYGGTTTVAANTEVDLGNGGVGGSFGAGAITDAGTILINQSGSVSSANVINGTGTLTQEGSGTTTLASTGTSSFSGAARVTSGELSVDSIQKELGTGTVTLAGGELLTTTTSSSSNVITLGAGTQTVAAATASEATYTGAISGAGSLDLGDATNTGTIVLAAANSYTGMTAIAADTEVDLGNGGAAGSFGAGAVTNDGAVVIDRTGTATIGNAIGGGGTLTQSGPGTTILTQVNGYSGDTAVTAGKLVLSGTGSIANSAVTVQSGATLVASGTSNSVGALSAGGVVSLQNGATNTLTADSLTVPMNGGMLAIDVGLTSSSSDELAVNNGATFTGALTVNIDTLANAHYGDQYTFLTIGSGGLLASDFVSSASEISGVLANVNDTVIFGIDNGGLSAYLIINGPPSSTYYYTGAHGTDFTAANNFNTDAGSDIPQTSAPNSGDDIYIGTSTPTPANLTPTLGANNLTINSLTFTATGSNATLSATTGVLTVMNGVTVLSGATNDTISAPVVMSNLDNLVTSETWTVTDQGATLTDSGGISGTLGLTKDGAGTLILDHANTYSGATLVNDGVLNLQNAGALNGTSGVTVASGGTLQLQGVSPVAVALTLAGGGLENVSGNDTYAGAVTLTSNSTISSDAGTLTLNNVAAIGGGSSNLALAGAGNGVVDSAIATASLSKSGAGTWTLNALNTYSGPTVINGGSLVIGAGSGLANSSLVDLAASGATLDISSVNQTINDLSGVAGSSLTLGTSQLTVGTANSTTFAGSIVGSTGSLVKVGTGTISLTGANSYSGGTTISAGALSVAAVDANLGSGGVTLGGGELITTTTSSTGQAITVNAGTNTLAAANGTAATYNGAIGGLGAVGFGDSANTGTIVLGGANTYAGGTNIFSGTVLAASPSAFGLGDVNQSGGTLAAAGPVGSAINVAGNYNMSGGTLVIKLSSGANDQLVVGGTATLNGTLSLNFTGLPTKGETYAVVAATGGIVGSPGPNFLAPIVSPPGYVVATAEGANADDFLVQVVSVQFDLTGALGVSASPNARAITRYIDANVTSGPLFNVISNALVNASNADAAALAGNIVDQFNPAKFGNFARSTSFNNLAFSTQEFDSVFESQRGADGNFTQGTGQLDSSGLTIGGADVDPSLASVSSRLVAWSPSPLAHGLLSDTPDPVLGGIELRQAETSDAPAPDKGDPFNAFIVGDVILGQDFSQPNFAINHTDSTSEQVSLGADYRITPHLRTGALFSYSHTDSDLDDNGSSATVDSYSPGAYASFADNGWYANAIGMYGFNSYTEDRRISLPGVSALAHGAPDGDQIIGDLDGGYDFHKSSWTFGPTAGVQYVHLDVNSFTEDGAGAIGSDESVGKQETDSLRSRVGGHVSYSLQTFGVTLTPHLDASWQHEFLDGAQGVNASIVNVTGSPFSVTTPNPSRDSALIDAGLSADINRQVTVFGDYTVQAGQDNYFGQSIQAGVKIGF